jgi:hypothetical protein
MRCAMRHCSSWRCSSFPYASIWREAPSKREMVSHILLSHHTRHRRHPATIQPFIVSRCSHLVTPGLSLDSSRDGWAVGWAGTLVHFDGNRWSTVPGPAKFKQNLLGIVMRSPADGWAVGDSGTILHYHDGTWNIARLSSTGNTLDSISMLSAAEGWIVGRQGTILHYRDGTWESVHPAGFYRNPNVYQSADFYGVDMNSIRSGWIAAGQHFLIYSSEVWIEPGNAINPLNGAYPGMPSNNLSLYATAKRSGGYLGRGSTLYPHQNCYGQPDVQYSGRVIKERICKTC